MIYEVLQTSKPGHNGPAVKRLQEWLSLHNCCCKPDGDYGAATEQAVRDFQAKHKLPVDGVATPAVVAQLTMPLKVASEYALGNAKLPVAIIETAKAYLEEHPREVEGANDGPWVRHFMNGIEGQPWCCGFVSTVVRQALAALKSSAFWPYDVSCARMVQRAQARCCLATDPAAGDIFCLRTGGPGTVWNHTGIVTAVDLAGGTMRTIEGNTNDDGSREGIEVCARVRSLRDKVFIRVAA